MRKKFGIKGSIGSMLLLVLFFNAEISHAQINVLLGFEGVSTLGEFKNIASVGGGASGGIEFGVSEKFGLTAQLGYIYLRPVNDLQSAHMFPLQGGLKYHLASKENGMYTHLQIGTHQISTTTEAVSSFGYYEPAESNSYSGISYALGIGYVVNGNVDLSLRYNIVSIDKKSGGYLGIRLAISFI